MTIEYAAWIGSIELVAMRITQTRCCEQNSKRWTALHSAVWNMHTDVVEILLDNGIVGLEAKCHEGWTPLHLAAMNNDFRMANILLEGGSDAESSDNEGNRPLHW